MTNLIIKKKLLPLLISPVLISSTEAAVFEINCGQTADLINAIETANGTEQLDKIYLNVDNQTNCIYPLTVVNNTTIIGGPNGLPSISSEMIIHGNQSTIRREEESEPFRIIHIAGQGQLTLKQLNIENGVANGHWFAKRGGGIYNLGQLILEKSSVSKNTAKDQGGGLYNENASMTLIESTVFENTAYIGGGLSNIGVIATLTNSTVSENIATGLGGGIFNSEGTLMTITNSTLSGNLSENRGGGIFNDLGLAAPNVENNTLSENTITAENRTDNSFSYTLIVINSTLADNTADLGGGIFSGYGTSTLFSNSTVSGNIANRGGGIFNDRGAQIFPASLTVLKNTIVAGNEAMTQPNCANEADDNNIHANHFNLFGNNTDCNNGENDFNLNDLGVTIDEVLNTTLADNNGPTQTLALVPNSPAIDAADDEVCPKTDQRAVNRLRNGQCDIGAFEYQPPLFERIRYSSAIPQIKRNRR